MGEFWVESYGGPFVGDLVGQIMDGSAPEDCALACPVNNSSHYYAGLADGYFYFGLNNDNTFKVKSLKASFMGIPEASTGVLVLQGFNANDQAIGTSVQLGLGGPNALGQYNFATYNLGAFSNTDYSYVRVLGYGCIGISCTRGSNLSNFAIDDIATIPEPTTWALIGLGLLGVGAFTRRRAA